MSERVAQIRRLGRGATLTPRERQIGREECREAGDHVFIVGQRLCHRCGIDFDLAHLERAPENDDGDPQGWFGLSPRR